MENFVDTTEKKAKKELDEGCWWDVHGDIPLIALYMASEEVAFDMTNDERLDFLGLTALKDKPLSIQDQKLIKRVTAVVLRACAKKPA